MGQFSMEISWDRVSHRWHQQAQAFLKTGHNPEMVQQLIDKGHWWKPLHRRKREGCEYTGGNGKFSEREMRNSRKYRFAFETRTETLRFRPAILGLGYGLDFYPRDKFILEPQVYGFAEKCRVCIGHFLPEEMGNNGTRVWLWVIAGSNRNDLESIAYDGAKGRWATLRCFLQFRSTLNGLIFALSLVPSGAKVAQCAR